MSDKKYIFFIDVDDTLVPAGQTMISPDIVMEIERLKKQGHIFIVSTGRALKATLCIKGIESFQFISALLGGCIFQMSNKTVLQEAPSMPSSQVLEFVEFLNSEKIEWSYKDDENEKTIFFNSKYFERRKERMVYVSVDEFEKDVLNGKVLQMLFVAHLPESLTKRFSEFEFLQMPNGYTDVSLKNCSKGRSVKFFEQMFQNMTTVAIGDSFNDMDMFKKAEISIAMGNAKDEIKKEVTFVTKDINENGLIYAFREILKL